jgi:HD superfamily phosphodiesterase
MDNLLVNKSIPIVQDYIRGQKRFSQAFRDRFEHTKRVLTWAKRIQQLEGGDLEIINLAVLFHDTGWSEEINHAQVSAELAGKFLVENEVAPQVMERVISAVQTHNLRGIPGSDLPLENQIVMDADLLDELGVTTMVWDAMTVAGQPEAGYLKVLEKDRAFYNNAVKRQSEMKTNTGLKLYRERLDTWRMVLDNLAFELGIVQE